MLISDCQIDPERIAPVRDCTETYGQGGDDPDNEWPWNVISKKAVAYSCGQICRRDDIIRHEHDPAELARCQKLANEVAGIMGQSDVGMGSESGDPFRPYFVAACVGVKPPRTISEDVIRNAFGGTIYPPTRIIIEPLDETGEWWKQVAADGEGIDDYLENWRKMIGWFHTRREFIDRAFVMIGEDPLDEEFKNGGCVFPRLAVGLTPEGSLIGICGWVVHT